MKVLHLSSYDVLGGAARAARRLHLGLRTAGVESRFSVRRAYGETEGIEAPRGVWNTIASRLRRRYERSLARRAGWRGPEPFSPGMIGAPTRATVARLAPDVVHAHWIVDGFCDVRDFSAFSRPVVWTFHDLWPLTGGCHYPRACTRYHESCGSCPMLKSQHAEDLSRQAWARKNDAYSHARLTGVAPSRWLADRARESSLWRDRDVRVIPYGIDTATFAPHDRTAARASLGLPSDRPLIVAGAVNFRADARKGFDLFLELADRLNALSGGRYAFAIFGDTPVVRSGDARVPLLELGIVSDEKAMANVYAAADLFVTTTREDNLPNTVIEAIACGTPAAAFSVGGLPEIIDDMVNGCLAPAFAVEELATKIHALLCDARHLRAASAAARLKAETEFSIATLVRRHRELYAELARP